MAVVAALLLVLAAVIVVNGALAIYLAKRARREAREHEQRLAADAAEQSIEATFTRIRGEAWTRAHTRH